MTKRAQTGRTAILSLSVTPALKTALELEAWESQMKLSDYVRGLLERRGKWARSATRAGGYDIGPPKEQRPGEPK
jgi:hypothetical protein